MYFCIKVQKRHLAKIQRQLDDFYSFLYIFLSYRKKFWQYREGKKCPKRRKSRRRSLVTNGGH